MSDFTKAADRDALAESIIAEQKSGIDIRKQDRATVCAAYLNELQANGRAASRTVAYFEHMVTVAGNNERLRKGARAALLGLKAVRDAAIEITSEAQEISQSTEPPPDEQ